MKIDKIRFGKIIDGFEFLPSISLSWIFFSEKNKRSYHLQFAWFLWYINIKFN